MRRILYLFLLFLIVLYSSITAYAQSMVNKPINEYTNPILHADYSDPDVIRVGEDFYMTASSFNQVPGLPILHSKDLVNWKLIAHVFEKQMPLIHFDTVRHGGGVWAPSIRFHNEEFYIYYPDPDYGIWMVKAKNAAGPWSEPYLVKRSKGWIDPCPFWDDNGNAYLINGMAASRSGIKSTLILSKMSPDGTRLLDNGVIVFDGHDKNPTVEGPKLYKRNGYYYIMAPAGGVGDGWQLALRSKNIYGPYEEKVVLETGSTIINGPHQGGLVETKTGESWFIHFQDKDAYGRIVHLQPVKWVNDWPIIGIDYDKNGVGEPVSSYKMPNVGKVYPLIKESYSDEFNDSQISKQWQWAANPQINWAFPAGQSYGFLRLLNVPAAAEQKNLWTTPNLLTQKFPSSNFTVTTKLTFTPKTDDEETGLLIMGIDYSYISIKKKPEGLVISRTVCENAEAGNSEIKSNEVSLKTSSVYFRVKVSNVKPTDSDYQKMNKAVSSKYGNAKCSFSYSLDGTNFIALGEDFAAKRGKWIGAKVGIFATREGKTYETGYADFDWFRVVED